MNPLSVLGVGLLLGIRHATDPDHVIAISTIVTRQKNIKAASIIGALWGIGHTCTVFVVGTAIVLLHVVIPARIGLAMEFGVAILLVVLGILNLTGTLQAVMGKLSLGHHTHTHIHFHGHKPHLHIHNHARQESEESGYKIMLRDFIDQFGWFQLLRPVVIGLVHGLAGSAAIALFILSTIDNIIIGLLYLFIFAVGTIVGMMGITTLLGLPIILSVKRFAAIHRYVNVGSGLLSITFGLFLAYKIGIVNQLFGPSPQWDPH